MIELHLAEVLERRGRTVYWLWKETNIRYATLWQISRGSVRLLNLEVLDRLCEALKCQPGELIVRVDETRKGRKRGK
jgi:putative transcriptional regulator